MFWCCTLGELALYADQHTAEPLMRAAKPIAILAYLGLQAHREAPRDHIVELFWPGTSLPEAHHALRQALYRLRQATSGEALLSLDDGTLRCADGVAFDWCEGERALAEGDHGRARLLLRGNFLEGFSFPNLRELTDWAEAMCTRFRAGYARAAQALIAQTLVQGEPGRAVEVAEEFAAKNPLDEGRIRLLMTALDKSGQARRALARFAEFAAHIHAQLDDRPSEELCTYARELERSLTPVIASASPTLPFVGRSKAWAALDAAWSKAEAGACGTILIEGDAGLGKTRLVEEFAARARASGGVWIAAKCYEIEQGLPYAAAGELIRSAARVGNVPPAPSFPQFAAENGAGVPEALGGASAGDVALREALATWFERISRSRPLFVTCDDIHWADEASLQVLHLLSHRLAACPVLIACTYRPVELAPDSRKFAVSLVGEGLARLNTLAPFTGDEVFEVLLDLAEFERGEFGKQLAQELHRHTGGNPLFLTELLEALAARRDLVRDNGRWVAAPSLNQSSLPKTIRKILTDRVDGLGPEQRDLLELVAVVSDTVPTALAAAALELSEPATEATLAELGRARLVRQLAPGLWQAAHDELRQLVHSAIPDDRRRRLHQAVGTALERTKGEVTPGDAARLAHHFEQAGESERARHYALVAAGEAAAVGASRARSALLAQAEALAPPPVRVPPAPITPPPLRRRRWVPWAVAAGLLIAAGAAAWDRWTPGGTSPPYTQGTLYVIASGHASDGQPLPKASVLPWPKRNGQSTRMQTLDRWPTALPPPLGMKLVRTGRQTHGKIVRIRARDTVQLTFGETDDGPAIWSPDRRLIAVQKGWRTGSHYRFNLFVIDTLGRDVNRLTDGAFNDALLDWSPDGTRIAFHRTVAGHTSLWVVAPDGGELENLTDTLALPAQQISRAVFSPDGTRLAVGMGDPEVVKVVDLRRRTGIDLQTSCVLEANVLAWSPDSRWLAIACRIGARAELGMLPADGSGKVNLVTELPASGEVVWMAPHSGYVTRVRVAEDSVTLPAHRGRSVWAEALNPQGESLGSQLRWTVGDWTVASVDPSGFVKGRRPGRTWLAASAGGLHADTVVLVVTAAAMDTLLYEDWSGGIDPQRWKVVGDPPPVVVEGAGVDGNPAFLSNGDDNWPSGVLSLADFSLAEGLTLEFTARFRLTGQDWQELEAVLIPLDSALVAGERRPTGAVARVWTTGPSPNYATGLYTCRTDWGEGSVTELFAPKPTEWHSFVVQVRPDHIVECYLDGILQARLPFHEQVGVPLVGLFLGGRSEYTTIYHGPVVVTRGLRY